MRSLRNLCIYTVMTLLLTAPGAFALPATGPILVVEATLIEGLADYHGEVVETESEIIERDGDRYILADSGLSSLEGLHALFLVDHRRDTQKGSTLERKLWQEVLPIDEGFFELSMLPDEPFWYQIADVNGELGLFGQGNLLRSEGGEGEPFQVWRIDGMKLVDRSDIALR